MLSETGPWAECQTEFVAVLFAAIHKTAHGWGDLPVKGFVLFGGDTGKSQHRAKSSAHVLVHYQRSLKFYVHLYVPFVALRPEYCLVQIVLFFTFRIHSWEGISVLKILYTFGNVLQYGIQRLAGRHWCASAAARLFLTQK